jgi:hypothetical protein
MMAVAFEFAGKKLSLVLSRADGPSMTTKELCAALVEGFTLDPETKQVMLLPCLLDNRMANEPPSRASFLSEVNPTADPPFTLTSLDVSSIQPAMELLAAGARFRVLVDHDIMTCGPTHGELKLSPDVAGDRLNVDIYPRAIVSANGTMGSPIVTIRFQVDATVAGSHLALERLVVKAGSTYGIWAYSPVTEERAVTVTRQAGYTVGADISASFPGGATAGGSASYTATTTTQPTAPIAEWGSCSVRQFGGEREPGVQDQSDAVRWDVFLRRVMPRTDERCCTFRRYPLQATAQLAKNFELTFALGTRGINATHLDVCFTVEARVRRFCHRRDAEDRPLVAPGALYNIRPATATIHVPIWRECLIGAYIRRNLEDMRQIAENSPPAANDNVSKLRWEQELAQEPEPLPAPMSALTRCLIPVWCCPLC